MVSRHPPLPRTGTFMLLLILPCLLRATETIPDSSASFDHWLRETQTEFQAVQRCGMEQGKPMRQRLEALNTALSTPKACIPEFGYPLLLEKIRIEEQLRRINADTDLKLLRLRFRKSIEMLKMLYEKILSMDHHFTGLRTSQQVMKISNPHEYPEFKEIKTILQDRMKKKYGFTMPTIMEGNPYLSAAFAIVGLALNSGDSKLSKQQLDQLSCILDFTVRIYQDLSVIYYETEYLRDGNLSIKKECENLFAECARQVGYTIPLTVCRETDDWEGLYALLDHSVDLAAAVPASGSGMLQKTSANLQFSVDRVVHFIEKYCAFVSQGNEYYKKFDKIVSSYANESVCSGTLPETFRQLKTDIGITLDKFRSAYDLPEIQGSRLKDMLYGGSD